MSADNQRPAATQPQPPGARPGILFASWQGLSTVWADAARRLHYMTNSDSDGLFDNDWEDRGELAWTELDWQKYLDTQETAVRDYIKHYDQLPEAVDRVDEAARRMGWELAADTTEAADLADEKDEEAEEVFAGDWDPY